MEPILKVADNSSAGDYSISVTLVSELVEPFTQKLQEINHLTAKNRLVYAHLLSLKKLIAKSVSLIYSSAIVLVVNCCVIES